jgi:DNA-binding transcriptional regulator YbjK
LDQAVEDDDGKAARRQLAAWRAIASEVQGLLTSRTATTGDLDDLLLRSVAQAAEAKAKLLDGRSSINKATEFARHSIAETCQQASIELGRLKSYSQGETSS